jgi:hypothetical protein
MEYLPSKGELNIKFNPPREGNDCNVEVVFPNDQRLPGLIGRDKLLRSGKLWAGGEPEQTIAVRGMRFLDERSKNMGKVYLTVDGYERAFIYDVRFGDPDDPPSQGSPVERPPVLRIVGADAVKPEEDYKFTVEVDNGIMRLRMSS